MSIRAILRLATVAAALAVGAPLLVAPVSQPALAQAVTAEALLQGAELIGKGRLTAYRKDGAIIVAIPKDAFDKPFLWYAEAVGVPSGVIAQKLEAASLLAHFERHGKTVLIRDLTTKLTNRGGGPEADKTADGPDANDAPVRPIDIAINTLDTGPVIATFSVAAEGADGSVLVDVTAVFSTDIASASGRAFVNLTGLVPMAVDPARTYIDTVRVFEKNLNIRTHLTFLAASPANPVPGPQPVSVVIGHSLVFLPEKPMSPRYEDRRVGYFTTKFTDFEAASGAAQETRSAIARFRLEKAHPEQAVSDPVTPITFYIGPGVPERWRPYVKAGVEQWLPAFEAAGFSNAIRVLNAPTPEEDPTWSVEDVSRSVIRWVPLPFTNAMGPHVIDPRSGETLSSHVLIWPSVIDYFSKYYFAEFGTVDPEAASLPLSTEKRGAILSYIVAHEIGHALGLRHNQIASTAYTIKQMRDPAFANKYGPNSSIMAYGRFNQVAQPGDGVTQLFGKVGAYDFAAIKWGYGDFGRDEGKAQNTLDELAATFTKDRRLYWGTAELQDEAARFAMDPRIQTENTASDRIEATRLGVANILRSLDHLDAATGGNAELFTSTYSIMLGTQVNLLKSVATLVAGSMPKFGEGEGPVVAFVPAKEQSRAVAYLLGEGVRSLEPYQKPAILERTAVFGGYRAIDRLQASLLKEVLSGSKIAILESQAGRDKDAYSPLDLGRDVAAAVWGDLDAAPFARRAVQRAYVAQTKEMLQSWATGGAAEPAQAAALTAQGYPSAFATIAVETGDDTIYPSWLRSYLPLLKERLGAAAQTAALEDDRLHFAEMAVQVEKLIAMSH